MMGRMSDQHIEKQEPLKQEELEQQDLEEQQQSVAENNQFKIEKDETLVMTKKAGLKLVFNGKNNGEIKK